MRDSRLQPALPLWSALVVLGSLALSACTVPASATTCVPGSVIPTTLADGGAAFLQCLANGSAYVLNEGVLSAGPSLDPDAGSPPAEALDASAGAMDSGTSATGGDASSGSNDNFCDHGGVGCTHSCGSGHCH